MGRSVKGADSLNEALTRGIRMAAKRTILQGKGCGAAVLVAGADEVGQDGSGVQERAEAGCADSLAEEGACQHGDVAVEGERKKAVGHGFGELESGEVDICAPRPLASPVLVVDGHPLTKRQQAQALAEMHMTRSTKAPHAPEMKVPSTRHSTFRPITEA
ncbi:hypothetical protein ERJ75_000520300 [Trypanosoma vivax]|nr:hypothetical protein ERJ75_000520300 [Trypanosoma vivax]